MAKWRDDLRVLFWCFRNPREVWTWMYTAWAVENYYSKTQEALALAMARRRNKDPRLS